MINLELEMKKNILNKLNEFHDNEISVNGWFKKEFLSEFGNYVIKELEALPVEDEGKYQYGGTIYQVYLDEEETDMFIMETWSRNGSYYSDYYYWFDEMQLCEQVQRIITDWAVIK